MIRLATPTSIQSENASYSSETGTAELYDEAVVLCRTNRFAEGIATLDTLLGTDPGHAKARALRAELLSASPPQATLKKSEFRFGRNFYGGNLLAPTTLARIAASSECWDEILQFHGDLATDEYVDYVDHYYRACRAAFGEHWYYFDLTNILYAAARAIQPRRYLEIGVRRGRSACVVARACPSVHFVGFDMWQSDYAGMANPGADFVSNELRKHGHTGIVELIDGDSHQTVPGYFADHPGADFDLITVDGDHSELGAYADLITVIPRLSMGGVIVFDDIAHPAHPYLHAVWRRMLNEYPSLQSFEFTESGFGAAFAIRKE